MANRERLVLTLPLSGKNVGKNLARITSQPQRPIKNVKTIMRKKMKVHRRKS
jgi:hypothetical protein